MKVGSLMKRRAILGGIALLGGGALVHRLVGGTSNRADMQAPAAGAMSSLSPEQTRLLDEISETIIPETNTAGARTAGVVEFIDHIVGNWYTADERDAFVSGLAQFAARCRQQHGQDFISLSPEQRLQFLEVVERESTADRVTFFSMMKRLTIVGYYTSQVGMEAIGYHGPVGGAPTQFGPNRSSVWN